jgi:hypothetical protein
MTYVRADGVFVVWCCAELVAAAVGSCYPLHKGQSGHTFSAANPYGVRAKGDNRQLARF